MIRIFLLSILAMFFIGCSSKEDVYVTKRIYKDISKDAVLEASKKVFLLSNQKKDFIIDSYRNKLKVTKVIFKDRVFRIDLYQDKWLLEVVQMDNESRANLILVRSDAINQDEKKSINEDVHEVFWARVEYLLGLTKDWKYCQTHLITTFDNSLCSNIFTSGKPEDTDMVKDKKIISKNNINTIDTIKSDVYETTDLSLSKQSSDLFEQSDKLPDSGIINPVSDETIMEIKALKATETTTEEKPVDETAPVAQTEDKVTQQNSEDKDTKENKEEKKDSKTAQEDKNINEFKNNLDEIVNTKNSTKEVDTQKIVDESQNIKEDNQFDFKKDDAQKELTQTK